MSGSAWNATVMGVQTRLGELEERRYRGEGGDWISEKGHGLAP